MIPKTALHRSAVDLKRCYPLRYFLILLRGSFLEGVRPSLYWPQYWPLALIGIVSMIVASRLSRSRLS